MDQELKEYECPVLEKMKGLLRGAKGRARENGRDFDLDLDYLLNLYVEICPILHIRLVWDNKRISCLGSPSLDRVDNKKGYVKGNVQIISHRANSLKKDYLLVEWEKMTQYMSKCDGRPLEREDWHFAETTISEEQEKYIRAALKRGENTIDISQGMEISLGEVLKIKRLLK